MSWKIPKHGSSFRIFAKFGLLVGIYDEIPKNGPKILNFWGKIPKNGTIFGQNDP